MQVRSFLLTLGLGMAAGGHGRADAAPAVQGPQDRPESCGPLGADRQRRCGQHDALRRVPRVPKCPGTGLAGAGKHSQKIFGFAP